MRSLELNIGRSDGNYSANHEFDPENPDTKKEVEICLQIEAPRGKPRGIFDSHKVYFCVLFANPNASIGECAHGNSIEYLKKLLNE